MKCRPLQKPEPTSRSKQITKLSNDLVYSRTVYAFGSQDSSDVLVSPNSCDALVPPTPGKPPAIANQKPDPGDVLVPTNHSLITH
ncbi:hypothetical protein TNCT_278221 [Trichonephila clavata]|uniref:Uncharacterized protein n=1 Tax=Trichonephila clavata TaxID=2740835 RepID=A0A8X6J9S5_TRICU|nr:hypothetical protein TNCT_278221 [Trichonephila clavata]